MAIIKKFGVLSVAKIYAAIMAVVGLIVGIFFALSAAVLGPGASTQLGPLVGIGALLIIVMPIFYCVLGFVAGAFTAWIYNVFAAWLGGVEIEFQETKKK